jgi:hypothetical protein
MKNYPILIADTGIEIARLTLRLAELREEIGLIETTETLAVLTEVNESGKPVFTNETSRAAALQVRLCDKAYQEFKSESRKAELEPSARRSGGKQCSHNNQFNQQKRPPSSQRLFDQSNRSSKTYRKPIPEPQPAPAQARQSDVDLSATPQK